MESRAHLATVVLEGREGIVILKFEPLDQFGDVRRPFRCPPTPWPADQMSRQGRGPSGFGPRREDGSAP